jgi:Asp-tRNA(Asn)/Glu-tRNA(Gln) amidotransferase A subunit family amidase
MTIEEYAQSLLRRIDERDSLVKAWAWLDREQLMEQARALDAVPLEQRSPIHGMPVAVKDVIYTKGML